MLTDCALNAITDADPCGQPRVGCRQPEAPIPMLRVPRHSKARNLRARLETLRRPVRVIPDQGPEEVSVLPLLDGREVATEANNLDLVALPCTILDFGGVRRRFLHRRKMNASDLYLLSHHHALHF